MVVPPRRAPHDPARLGADYGATCSALFLNGDEFADRSRAAASRSSDDSFLLLFNAHHEDVTFTLPARRFGRSWALELSTADPSCSAGARATYAARSTPSTCRARSITVLKRLRPAELDAIARPTACSSARSCDFADVRALVPYLRDLGISHLYLSPSLTGALGLDARLRRRRPDAVSARRSAARTGCARSPAAGLRIVLDIVPNHMGTGDENRWWADPAERARVFDVDPETGRYRRFFDIDDLAGVRVEDPEVFELTHAKVLQLVARRRRRRAARSTIPTGSPTRPATSSGCATRAPSTSGSRRSCTPASRACATGRSSGTVGYEFLNDAQRAVRRPGRRGAR